MKKLSILLTMLCASLAQAQSNNTAIPITGVGGYTLGERVQASANSIEIAPTNCPFDSISLQLTADKRIWAIYCSCHTPSRVQPIYRALRQKYGAGEPIEDGFYVRSGTNILMVGCDEKSIHVIYRCDPLYVKVQEAQDAIERAKLSKLATGL